MVILAIRHIYLHFIMTYTYIINIEFSHMMNDYMVHMVHRITTSRTDTAPARLTSSSSSARGPPHVVVVSTPATAPTRIYMSFVFICMYIYVAEHRHPRSPMRFYVYDGAPPPSFTHVYRHIYGRVEHRHSTPPFLVA